MVPKDADLAGRRPPLPPDADKPNFEGEEGRLLEFFRANTTDLPETVGAWFDLPNGREQISLSFDPSEDAAEYISDAEFTVYDMKDAGPRMHPFGYLSERLTEAEERFSGNDLKKVKVGLYKSRYFSQKHFVERGVLKDIPQESKISTFASLSIASDLMKIDIENGYISPDPEEIVEGFIHAQMLVIYHRIVEKFFGNSVKTLDKSTGVLFPKISAPEDEDVAEMQRKIVSRLQAIM